MNVPLAWDIFQIRSMGVYGKIYMQIAMMSWAGRVLYLGRFYGKRCVLGGVERVGMM